LILLQGINGTDKNIAKNKWEIRKINDIVNDLGDDPFGSNLKTKDYVKKGVPVIRGRNIKNNRFGPIFTSSMTIRNISLKGSQLTIG